MTTWVVAALIAAFAALPAAAQTTGATEKPEQVVVPEVERRDVTPPRFPSNDFEAGLFAGTYSTQNFGSSAVLGLRLGYHVTEDIFVQAAFAQTNVSDEAFRRVLPGGIFPQPEEKLTYYNLSAGYNLLPGEVFIGRNRAKLSSIYVIGGVGSTSFNEQRRQTINFGVGMRVLLADWAAVQVDMRDHVFSMDLLGERESTQNLELTAGVSFFF